MKKNNFPMGRVKKFNNKYVFVDKNGNIYDIPQSKQFETIAKSRETVVIQSESNKNGLKNLGSLVKNLDPIPEGRHIAKKYKLFRSFNDRAQEEAYALPDKITPDMMVNSTDYRDVPFVTIDPDDAKDYDDAVFAKKLENGNYVLMVAIANVAKFVTKDSALFKEAVKRGTSAYLGDFVYPMYPEKLSNGICSLNEKEDRLVMCTTAELTPDGKCVKYMVEPAVINSKKRLTYKQAQAMYDDSNFEWTGDPKDREAVDDSLRCLYEVSDILERKRMDRGALDVRERVSNFVLDKNKTKVIDVVDDDKPHSTKVIESTAILANEIWFDLARKLDIPFVSRVHEGIAKAKMEGVANRLAGMNIVTPINSDIASLQKVINEYDGTNLQAPVSRAILTALTRAKYSNKEGDHAGLGIKTQEDVYKIIGQIAQDKMRSEFFKATGSKYGFLVEGDDLKFGGYGHTTSPIRRISDDVNQMNMLAMIINGVPIFNYKEVASMITAMNETERNADDASREYDKMLAAMWAKDHIGEEFHGLVMNNNNKGTEVEIRNSVDVLIPMEDIETYIDSALPADYGCCMEDVHGNKFYKVGDEVSVVIDGVGNGHCYKIKAYDSSISQRENNIEKEV